MDILGHCSQEAKEPKRHNNNAYEYRNFLEEYQKGLHYPDKDHIIVKALANVIRRTFILINGAEIDPDKKLIKINQNYDKSTPPIILGVYYVEGKIVFLPYFLNKNLEFSLDSIKGKVQIVAYLGKSVGEKFKSHAILDLESFAVLTALECFKRFFSGSKTYLLTDSKVLYFMFNQKIGDSCVKIRRWVLKLIGDYPLLILYFVRTAQNLADYLTRQGMPKGDVERLCLKNVVIGDFFEKLPKPDFTLKEWQKFCQDNPQYLTVNQAPTIYNITQALSKGIDNIREVSSPLDMLKNKFSRDIIIKEQKKEFEKIYQKCLASPNFTYSDTNKRNKITTYTLILDLLMIEPEERMGLKIYVPTNLIGILLAYTHLLGHLGTGKMLKNLQSYYFAHMYTTVRRFASKCYSCFLMHTSSRKQKLGTYPIPDFPMEEISLDLIENLNKSGGFQNILVSKCALTDFTLLFPLKSKTSQEIGRMLKYGILQQYNVKRVVTDNGPGFRHANLLSLLQELKVEVVNTSSRNPSARGFIEAEVQIIKLALKKILAGGHSRNLNWEDLPLILGIILNHTVSPRTGFSPSVMMYGENSPMAQSFLELENFMPKPHNSLRNKAQLLRLATDIQNITNIAKQTIQENQAKFHHAANETRINKEFKKNDVVFTIDRTIIPGNSRPLKTKLSPSPNVVLKVFHTTLLIMRLADGFKMLISMNDVKKYMGTDKAFDDLPQEIKTILVGDFKDITPQDLEDILHHDPLNIPDGLELGTNDEDSNSDDENEESTPSNALNAAAPTPSDSLPGTSKAHKGKGIGKKSKPNKEKGKEINKENISSEDQHKQQLNSDQIIHNTDHDSPKTSSNNNSDKNILQDDSSDEDEDNVLIKKVHFENNS